MSSGQAPYDSRAAFLRPELSRCVEVRVVNCGLRRWWKPRAFARSFDTEQTNETEYDDVGYCTAVLNCKCMRRRRSNVFVGVAEA